LSLPFGKHSWEINPTLVAAPASNFVAVERILIPEGKEIQTFSTKTAFLLQLIDWIKEYGCIHVQWNAQEYSGSQLLIYLKLNQLNYPIDNIERIVS
jgi:hypothetical protein